MPAAASVLGSELTIAFAAAHHASLLERLADGGNLRLDLSGVSDFDSSGVQLLLSARRSLAERGDALLIEGASAAVREALDLYGLNDLLAGQAAAGSA